MDETKKPAGELPYEDVMERLSLTVERLEKGELALDDQIRAFEEGVALVRRGQALLDAAERKVEQLLAGERTAPFEPGESEET